MTTRLSNDYCAFPYIFFRRWDRSKKLAKERNIFIFDPRAPSLPPRFPPYFSALSIVHNWSPRFESLLSKKTRRRSDPALAQCNSATQSQAVTSGGTGPIRAPLSKPQLPADARRPDRAGTSACGRGVPDRRRESIGTGGR